MIYFTLTGALIIHSPLTIVFIAFAELYLYYLMAEVKLLSNILPSKQYYVSFYGFPHHYVISNNLTEN